MTSSFEFPAISLGFSIFGEIFMYVSIKKKSNHRCSHILSSLFFVVAFTCLGHECQDLLNLCNGMHVCTD